MDRYGQVAAGVSSSGGGGYSGGGYSGGGGGGGHPAVAPPVTSRIPARYQAKFASAGTSGVPSTGREGSSNYAFGGGGSSGGGGYGQPAHGLSDAEYARMLAMQDSDSD
eukprot:GFYU01015389.1.p2 GENE.GFYU01015389.1~~GFYU01015389.1.p2  ORF type:complete len:109 (-),score=25.41 GFYU01015389.1:157-483(-)